VGNLTAPSLLSGTSSSTSTTSATLSVLAVIVYGRGIVSVSTVTGTVTTPGLVTGTASSASTATVAQSGVVGPGGYSYGAMWGRFKWGSVEWAQAPRKTIAPQSGVVAVTITSSNSQPVTTAKVS
jgi:hypothetical protein